MISCAACDAALKLFRRFDLKLENLCNFAVIAFVLGA